MTDDHRVSANSYGALARLLARHQLADVLPAGVTCTCGEELAALNAPLDNGSVKGEPLALAVHQLQMLEPPLLDGGQS